MSRLRVLLIGQGCNPERVSISLVSFYHAAALAQLHDVTIVAHSSVEAPLRRSKAPFRSIEVVKTPLLDRIFNWGLRRIFKYNYDSQSLTAFRWPIAVVFEWRAWRQLRSRIRAAPQLSPSTPLKHDGNRPSERGQRLTVVVVLEYPAQSPVKDAVEQWRLDHLD